ncbi:superoxide dismutase [Cu-Zn], chloroplastic-like [Ostrinia furnacalis]|uniref:superoxide dismutase [Cu-Zn], chloroplastic-like n=1 Tax=Ostrinia furnacalis TaxID=93504 RepID=UPI00103868D8|nr:superoxide dismutase [Cu-Zn], chloroplastic-like [Ostrinia furnacalis]
MYFCFAVCLVLASVASCFADNEHRVAVAYLRTENVTGKILFTETDEGLRVSGAIVGLEEGHYGFHIHELGDVDTCLTTGAHFNPDNIQHGGRDDEVRHVGDLGNVIFAGAQIPVSNFQFVDGTISLRGRNNILGRGLVLHEQEDDLGRGDHPDSLTTGNAGARVACAVIGMHAPVDAWHYNSSFNIGPSVSLIASILMLSFILNK